jgi:hypothetical protein
VTRDFTFEIYEELLAASLDAGYEHITVREYLTREDLPDRFIIHRHDVDRKPKNALTMARLEGEYDISATYYFRTINKTLKPELISQVEDLGHEIGYHYEDMDRTDGNVDGAHESFSDHLGRLREIATIDTICMHGNPLTPYDNRDMWDGTQEFERYGLLGEAYLSMDFVDVTYFSDTGRTWEDGELKVKDNPVGESKKTVRADSTQELLELIDLKEFDRGCVLSHPNRWADDLPEYITERVKDMTVNLGKRGINLVN